MSVFNICFLPCTRDPNSLMCIFIQIKCMNIDTIMDKGCQQ
ncbi:hypothetical protein PROVRETT_09894 [Providencia rettgeri DSM 1131]|nr:hypothetical protein PROVRETT_09894 [Providencia rettgeri DSM 1131]